MAFSIRDSKFGQERSVVVEDIVHGHFMEILPDRGALPIKIQLHHVDIVESLESPKRLDNDHWFRNFWLLPYPNRTKDGQYEFEGRTYQMEVNETDKNNALHGFFHLLNAANVESVVEGAEANITIMHQYKGDQQGYPFAFDTTITYTITEEGKIKVSLKVLNTGKGNMPLGVGWHPYFTIPGNIEDWKITVGTLTHVKLGDRNLPTGETVEFGNENEISRMQLDDCFRFEQEPYRLAISNAGYVMEIEQDENFPFLQLFTPGRGSMAIEPMSCGVNAFNTKEGLRVLVPSEKFEGVIQLALSKSQVNGSH